MPELLLALSKTNCENARPRNRESGVGIVLNPQDSFIPIDREQAAYGLFIATHHHGVVSRADRPHSVEKPPNDDQI